MKEGGKSVTYPPTELLNRGCWPHFQRRFRWFRAQSIVFLLWEAWRVCCEMSRCYFFLKSTILYYNWFSLPSEGHFVIFKRGLKDFVQHSVYSCWSWFQNHFCTILKRLIGSVPIGEGPRDVAQWRGWTPLSNSILWLSDSVFFFPTSVYQFCFSFLF